LNCHATRIKHLQEIEQEWLADQARPGLTASDAPAVVVMPIAEFNAGGIECEFGYMASSCGPRLQVNFDNIAIHEFADDPILAAGYEYWQSLPAQAGIPDWRDIDPVQMPKQILPNVALLEILDGGADAIFRLAGQEFDENFGVSPKGKTTAELLLDSRQAVYSESAFRWDLGHHLKTQRILMPLSHGQPDVIEMIIKIQTWPKEEMRGLPFCEVIENSANVSNSKPQVIRPNDG
jgi:hypothetical protein